jgi:hypothetical protein
MRRNSLFPRILLPLSVLLLFGCRDDATGIEEEYKAEFELIVVPEEVRLLSGQSFQLSVMLKDRQGRLLPLPPGDQVAWGSSDPDIAEVSDDGTVLALAAGHVEISADRNGQCVWATVQVRDGWLP